MLELTPSNVAKGVIDVMQGVLVHQRARWSQLVGQQRNFEVWWKAEFAIALESWTWSSEMLPHEYWVLTEAKPRYAGITDDGRAADHLVGPCDEDGADLDWSSHKPRVWIELKERGTWWQGGAPKAFGSANGGLEHDLAKWESGDWGENDVVLFCQLVTHEGTFDQALDPSWRSYLDEVIRRFDKGAVPEPRFVAFPTGGNSARWAGLYVFPVVGSLG